MSPFSVTVRRVRWLRWEWRVEEIRGENVIVWSGTCMTEGQATRIGYGHLRNYEHRALVATVFGEWPP